MFLLLLACNAHEPAEVVFSGGTIILTPGMETDALAIADGKVVGTGDEARALIGDGTREVDLGGWTLVPGMMDSHTHLLAGSFALDRLLLLGVGSMSTMVDRVESYARTAPDEPWIVGYGWLPEQVGDPDGRLLDAVAPDRPVVLVDNSGHTCVVNGEALRRAGITAATPDPPGGEIVHDPDTGEPTGWLREAALSLVSDVALADYDDERLASGLLSAIDTFVDAGLTGVAEIMALPGFNLARPWIYRDLEDAGELRMRVVFYAPVFTVDDVDAAADMAGQYDGELVRFGGGKVWVDGSMGSDEAWVSEPLEGTTDDYGLHYFDAAQLTQILRRAEELGVPMKLHANGDAAVHAAIEAFEAVAAERGGLAQQHSLEHVVLLEAGDAERIAALDIVASVQPSHVAAAALGDTAESWGEERFGRAYDHRGLLDTGITLAMGTDWPVWPAPSPILSIQTAATRAEGALDVAESMRAYTTGSAKSMGLPELGTLELGKAADFVILDANPLAIDPGDLVDVRVKSVWVNGDKIF